MKKRITKRKFLFKISILLSNRKTYKICLPCGEIMRGDDLCSKHVFLHGETDADHCRPMREGERPIEPINDGWTHFSNP